MGAGTKCVIYCSDEDWERGCNIVLDSGREEIFISAAIDSLENDTQWHRLRMNSRISDDSSIVIYFYASNEKMVKYNDEIVDIDEIILNANIAFVEKDMLFENLWVHRLTNPKDALLHRAKGRYLWLKIEKVSHSKTIPEIDKLKIEFPKESFVEYLPDIYQKDAESYDLLSRFIGIFQSLFLDLEENIDSMPKYFEPDGVDSDFLNWLSQWVSIEDNYIWSQEKLRYLVKNAFRLYSIKGTKAGIEEIVTLYSGTKPIIIEQHSLWHYEFSRKNKKLIDKLYGDNVYTFTVMVGEESVPTMKNYLELKRVIDMFKPANTMANLVVLKQYMFLDGHTYLGINSSLNAKSFFKIDGSAAVSYNTILSHSDE